MRHTFSIALVLLVFSGSMGIPLYRHTCSHENVTIRTLFTASDHCAKMEEPVVPKHACCAEKAAEAAKKPQFKKESCCKENVTRLAMAFNYFEHAQAAVSILPQQVVSVDRHLLFAAVLPPEKEQFFPSGADPPPLSGRERLCQHCILRL